jgi:hypothetical protein
MLNRPRLARAAGVLIQDFESTSDPILAPGGIGGSDETGPRPLL